MSAPPATSCAAARLRSRDNHASPAESSIAFGSHVIPQSKSPMSPFRRHARATDLGVAARAAAGSTNSPAHSLFEAGKIGWGWTRRAWQCKPVEQTTSATSSAGPLRISGTARLLQTRAPALEDHSHGVNIRPSSNSICVESIPYAPDFGPARRAQLLPFAEATWTTMSRSTTGARPPSTPGPRSRVLSFASNLPQVLNHALGYRRSARYSTAALATRPAATTSVLPPPTVPPSPQSAAANCHSATPVPSLHRHKIRPPPPL